ncbi:hypothetical protein BH20ACT17_BH20ACT17_05860 [soil metagenome]
MRPVTGVVGDIRAAVDHVRAVHVVDEAVGVVALWCKIPRTTKLNLSSVVMSATLTRRGKLISSRRARSR